MQKIINRKLYNTDTAIPLAEFSVYSGSGNYAGSDTVCITPGGKLMIHQYSTGQDCWRRDNITAMTPAEILDWLSGREITDTELAALREYLDIGNA